MKPVISRVKGTHDILPGESERWQALEDMLRRLMRCYNYHEIRTPIFERTELFARSVGETTDIVSKEMYTFQDKAGVSLTLRPELTAAVVRSYLQNDLRQQSSLTKLWYFGPLFRQERPQKGRFRQFWQFGVEALGSPYPEQEVEVIALFSHLLQELGLAREVTLRLNSVGDGPSRDKYREALRTFLKPLLPQLSETSRVRFQRNPLRILDTKDPEERALLTDAPRLVDYLTPEAKAHFHQVQEMLQSLGIEYQIDHHLVRGLDYYTQTIFEFTSDRLGGQDAICGGGRYDNLVSELGGPDTPAVGWAAGVERLLLVLGENWKPHPPALDVFIIRIEEGPAAVLELAEKLRQEGLKVEIDTLRRSVKAQMREANRKGARFAAFFGPEERGQNKVRLKNLRTGNEQLVTVEQLMTLVTSEQLNKGG